MITYLLYTVSDRRHPVEARELFYAIIVDILIIIAMGLGINQIIN